MPGTVPGLTDAHCGRQTDRGRVLMEFPFGVNSRIFSLFLGLPRFRVERP